MTEDRNAPRQLLEWESDAGLLREMLALPNRVIPVAGQLLGWPADAGALSPRLPLAATVHAERFDDSRAREIVDAYDARRRGIRPYPRQRLVERFGESPSYG